MFKNERRVAVWARSGTSWRFIRNYPILAASGHAGPKLRQGDLQVPEGVYRIEHLNPNSSYHLSMKVSYPNAFDRRMAARDGRTRLGGDIFIHGKDVSIGCVALGDRAIEELFTLVAETGHAKVKVIIAPNDLRVAGAAVPRLAAAVGPRALPHRRRRAGGVPGLDGVGQRHRRARNGCKSSPKAFPSHAAHALPLR